MPTLLPPDLGLPLSVSDTVGVRGAIGLDDVLGMKKLLHVSLELGGKIEGKIKISAHTRRAFSTGTVDIHGEAARNARNCVVLRRRTHYNTSKRPPRVMFHAQNAETAVINVSRKCRLPFFCIRHQFYFLQLYSVV